MGAWLLPLTLLSLAQVPADAPKDDDWRVDGKKPFAVPPTPAPDAAAEDEERVNENTPPPPKVHWPPLKNQRLEEDDEPEDRDDPAVQLASDRRYARFCLIGGDAVIAATFAVGYGLSVDGSASFKLSLAGGSFAALLGPGLLIAFNTDRSVAEVWLDWFGWLGGALTAAAVYLGTTNTPFEVITAMAAGGLLAHLALVLSPDREGVRPLELLLMGAGFTIATALFALTIGGLSNSEDLLAQALPRLCMILPGLVLAATRIGFAAGHAWGYTPSVSPLSFFAAPRSGGMTAGVGMVF